MQNQEKQLLQHFRAITPSLQIAVLQLAKDLATKRQTSVEGRLGADEQAISIKVRPSSVASR